MVRERGRHSLHQQFQILILLPLKLSETNGIITFFKLNFGTVFTYPRVFGQNISNKNTGSYPIVYLDELFKIPNL